MLHRASRRRILSRRLETKYQKVAHSLKATTRSAEVQAFRFFDGLEARTRNISRIVAVD